MSSDVVTLMKDSIAALEETLRDVKETIKYLGAAQMCQVQIGDVVMDCAVFAPSRTEDAESNEAAQ